MPNFFDNAIFPYRRDYLPHVCDAAFYSDSLVKYVAHFSLHTLCVGGATYWYTGAKQLKLKENNAKDGFIVDKEDSSVTRCATMHACNRSLTDKEDSTVTRCTMRATTHACNHTLSFGTSALHAQSLSDTYLRELFQKSGMYLVDSEVTLT
eukprot:6370475-Pyramimonas_sp.AAC.1